MNYFEAHKLLDRAKDGQTISRTAIDYALFLTGDAPERGQGMDFEIPAENQGTGQSQGISLVADHDCRHFQAQG
jgi:hypothetical protein